MSVFATVLLLPLWRWIEARYHIESVGHSGPAGWCFVASYALVTAAGVAAWWAGRKRRRS